MCKGDSVAMASGVRPKEDPKAPAVPPRPPPLFDEYLPADEQPALVPLNTEWVLSAHSNDNANWAWPVDYVQLGRAASIQGFWAAMKWYALRDYGAQYSLNLFRGGIAPVYEDANNANGGVFSLRVPIPDGDQLWQDVCMVAVGETLLADHTNVTGVSAALGTARGPAGTATIKIWHRLKDQAEERLPAWLREQHPALQVRFLNRVAPVPTDAAVTSSHGGSARPAGHHHGRASDPQHSGGAGHHHHGHGHGGRGGRGRGRDRDRDRPRSPADRGGSGGSRWATDHDRSQISSGDYRGRRTDRYANAVPNAPSASRTDAKRVRFA